MWHCSSSRADQWQHIFRPVAYGAGYPRDRTLCSESRHELFSERPPPDIINVENFRWKYTWSSIATCGHVAFLCPQGMLTYKVGSKTYDCSEGGFHSQYEHSLQCPRSSPRYDANVHGSWSTYVLQLSRSDLVPTVQRMKISRLARYVERHHFFQFNLQHHGTEGNRENC